MGSCRVLLSVCAVALLGCNPVQSFAQVADLRSTLTDDGTDAPDATAAEVPALPNAVQTNGQADEAALPRKPKARPNPYEPLGIGDGPVQFHASLETDGVFSSNVKTSSTNPHSDFGLRLAPTLSFATNWSRHEWHGTVVGDFIAYAHTPSANSYTGNIETGGRVEVRRDTQIDFDTSLATYLSTGGDPEVPSSATGPARSWAFSAASGLTHDFGPISTRVKLGMLRNAYDDVALSSGGVEANGDRNYWEPSLAVRGTFGTYGARLRPYVELTYDPRFHDQVPDRNGQDRNSQGGGLAVGLNLDDGPIWMGDISANFIARNYDDPALNTAMALGLNGFVTWSLTSLWNIVASSGVTLSESEQVDVSATPGWNGGLQIAYALYENVKLKGDVSVSAINDAGGLDTTTVASLGADWQLNPYLSLSGSLQNTWFNAADGNGNYTELRVMTGVVLRH
jgi:hypothetical protein